MVYICFLRQTQKVKTIAKSSRVKKRSPQLVLRRLAQFGPKKMTAQSRRFKMLITLSQCPSKIYMDRSFKLIIKKRQVMMKISCMRAKGAQMGNGYSTLSQTRRHAPS